LRPARRRLALGLAAAMLAGCGAGAMGSPPPSVGTLLSATSVRALRGGAGHACLVPGPGRPVLDWSRLDNPILSYRSAGAKDEAVLWTGDRWHMLFSYLTADPSLPGGVSWNIATATSPDLSHWSAADPWPHQLGTLGVASPDIVRDPGGQYLVTYQSDPGETDPPGRQDRLYYRMSKDLRIWSAPLPLAPTLAPLPGDRMIDGALVFTGHQLLLGFKFSSPTQPQAFEIARSTTGSPQGPWQVVGRPDIVVNGDTIENYEFVHLAGRWRLVATSNNLDQPWLFTLTGDPQTPRGWLHWTAAYQLNVPSQQFNRGPGTSSVGFEHANSAYLCDATSLPGHFYYLLYAGSDELTRFGGWGHAQIGVARSTDLVHWHVPPG
jgi:hypothetical protein